MKYGGDGSLKNRIIHLICAASITLSASASAAVPVHDSGKMSSDYGYVLDDYIRTYGVISDEHPNGSFEADGTTGVVYGDTVMLDPDLPPYLIIYVSEDKYKTASCHIWKYNEVTKKADRIAVIEKAYDEIIDKNGEFALGWTDEKKYIVYKEYKNNVLCNSEYYTAIGNDAFKYVNNPGYINESGIMDFNRYYFHSGINVSEYNKALSDFYDTLKNDAADSIELENFADRLDKEDEDALEKTAAKIIGFKSFDINDYTSSAEYENALAYPKTEDRFYLITHLYDLGERIYYMRFSTDRSYYNYALLRKTDTVSDGYQILKVRTDCIPLSASELDEIRDKCLKSNLLYKKSKTALKAQKVSEQKPQREPKIKIEKKLDKRFRLPAACIGGAIVLSLIALLWIKLFNDD